MENLRAPFNEVHLFIDESGRIDRNEAGDVRLVGGVCVLGPYDDGLDARLREALRTAVESVGGQMPRDLHGGDCALGPEQREALATALQAAISQADPEGRVRGVTVTHRQDSVTEGPRFVRERERDNRYVAMLFGLLEHLVFTDPTLLPAFTSPSWDLHLHVAERSWVFAGTAADREALEALGYKVREMRRRGHSALAIHGIVSERELRALVWAAGQDRWARTGLNLTGVSVEPIDYASGRSPAALYLADLALGRERERELRLARVANTMTEPLVPTLARVSYGPWLSALADLREAIEQRSLDRFLVRRRDLDIAPKTERLRYSGLIQALDTEAAPLLAAESPVLRAAFDAACDEIDAPGGLEAGLIRAERCYRLLDLGDAADVRTRVQWTRARLSAANHMADSAQAEALWAEYLRDEAALAALGASGIDTVADVRNRRAVSLLDRLRLDDARKTLAEVIHMQESSIGHLARVTGHAPRSRSVGACYGTLGQVEAMAGNANDAEVAFRVALDHMEDPRDIERQWVYLGHLACDRGAGGSRLWGEVCEHLPALASTSPTRQRGQQFVLALQLKGHAVFSPLHSVREVLSRWHAESPLDAWPEGERAHHPFGLIRQAVGLLEERVATDRASAERAAAAYSDAATHLRGEGVLRVLSRAAALRGALALSDHARDCTPQIASAFRELQAAVIAHAGTGAWDETAPPHSAGHFGRLDQGGTWPERGRAVLGGIRHNLW